MNIPQTGYLLKSVKTTFLADFFGLSDISSDKVNIKLPKILYI